MQRTTITLAYFIICVNCFSQQYPFVHYTPENGLISNQVRNIYQDSRGRLYFSTLNGLSVYDGSRFINYTTKNGLAYNLVNCVMEMGEDSVWIITNSHTINCLVKGKIKKVELKGETPIINNIYKDDKGKFYAAADEGLYLLDADRFIKLPFFDSKGNDVNFYVVQIIPAGDYLLIQRDFGLLREERHVLYLYNKTTNTVTDEVDKVSYCKKSADGRIWISTPKKIMSININELKKGKLLFDDLPEMYKEIRGLGNFFILFDNEGNCWLGDQNKMVIKATPEGKITRFTKGSGLDFLFIYSIITDKEGSVWMATNNAGVYKLVQDDFSLIEEPFGFSSVSDISFDKEKNGLLLFSIKEKKLLIVKDDNISEQFTVRDADKIEQVFKTPNGLYGVGQNNLFKMIISGDMVYPKILYRDTIDQEYTGSLVDNNGNLFVCGRYILAGIIKDKKSPNSETLYLKKLNSFADHLASDSKGNIWLVTRAYEVIMYKTLPEDPAHYLKQIIDVPKPFPGISPRSIAIDKYDNIWIGTRDHGIHAFKWKKDSIDHLFSISNETGLSDNFITQLVCDDDNNIWAASPSGLDKITMKNGKPVIENLTKQNNIYQKIFKVVVDNNHNTWALVSNGLIKISIENKNAVQYSPSLMLSLVKNGKDTVTHFSNAVFDHKQNNLQFYFAATSFLNEKQILYSYRLSGGSNDQWSEASNNASVSFIDLPHGNYTLQIKAIFPASRYPEQLLSYKFSILPAWWQTWWFRSLAGLFIIGLLIIGVRFYYSRKLEKQMAVLEKQRAIEKERTRIATDMHDDLGAGLSRIKFLSENMKVNNGNNEAMLNDIEKISAYSDEMAAKMGEIVWALNEKNDTVADLVAFTRSYVQEYLSGQDIRSELNTPLELPSTFITGEMRQHIFLSVKECLHNIVKHARASQVYFSVRLNGEIEIIIHDNGKGIDLKTMRPFSNGIQNIQKRMNEIHGKVIFLNEEGTKVIMNIPHNDV